MDKEIERIKKGLGLGDEIYVEFKYKKDNKFYYKIVRGCKFL